MAASNKISSIVRIRQMLRRWRRKAAMSPSSSSSSSPPLDVPAGHVAIRVGTTSSKRFVVPATYLNHPVFKKLLAQAEEEYGFATQGPLTIPCDESAFEEVLLFVSMSESTGRSATRKMSFEDFESCCCRIEGRSKIHLDKFAGESLPLIGGAGSV